MSRYAFCSLRFLSWCLVHAFHATLIAVLVPALVIISAIHSPDEFMFILVVICSCFYIFLEGVGYIVFF